MKQTSYFQITDHHFQITPNVSNKHIPPLPCWIQLLKFPLGVYWMWGIIRIFTVITEINTFHNLGKMISMKDGNPGIPFSATSIKNVISLKNG